MHSTVCFEALIVLVVFLAIFWIEELNFRWDFFTKKAEQNFRDGKLNLNIDCI